MRNYMEEYQRWLDSPALSNAEWEELNAIRDDKKEIESRFFAPLEFGTAGLRGEMALGCRRMNIHVIRHATQAFAEVIKSEGESACARGIAICFDCRINSERFAHEAAGVMAANGIHVRIFDALRPTPELSFAVKHYGTTAGLNITASHNPKEYNGYKAYWDDGAQMIAPHDKNTIAEVNKIRNASEIKFKGNKELIEIIGKEIDEQYINDLTKISLSPESIARHHDMKIVYTPIHGTGVTVIPPTLKAFGFTNIIHVPEQDVVSGDFPTVVSPNPEEPAALALAVEKAKETDAELVLASDPDADRVGAAVKNNEGEWVLLNGNQTALMFVYYLITRWKELGKINGKEYIVKTIVTTELIRTIAEKNGVEVYDVYTGFKWIADVMKKNEGKKNYIGGGEESYGFLCEDFVRDKDAVSACAILAEIAAWAKDQGITMYQLLQNIYVQYGFSKEKGISVVKKGKSGAEEIEAMMKHFRENPLQEIAGSKVTLFYDYASLKGKDYVENETLTLDMPTTSNVLQYFTEDGTKVSIRPSGTEPKIKVYILGVGATRAECDERVQRYAQFAETLRG